MLGAKGRLILATVLFLAWISYLFYLVLDLKRQAEAGGGQPVVLSRPQLLVADLIVTAAVEGKEDRPAAARVEQVHWARTGDGEKWKGQTIPVENLAASRGLAGPGLYILPLVKEGDRFRVAAIPPSPGYPPGAFHVGETGPPQVYPSNPFTEEQVKQIVARFQGQ
jgi:hypothetical protein